MREISPDSDNGVDTEKRVVKVIAVLAVAFLIVAIVAVVALIVLSPALAHDYSNVMMEGAIRLLH